MVCLAPAQRHLQQDSPLRRPRTNVYRRAVTTALPQGEVPVTNISGVVRYSERRAPLVEAFVRRHGMFIRKKRSGNEPSATFVRTSGVGRIRTGTICAISAAMWSLARRTDSPRFYVDIGIYEVGGGENGTLLDLSPDEVRMRSALAQYCRRRFLVFDYSTPGPSRHGAGRAISPRRPPCSKIGRHPTPPPHRSAKPRCVPLPGWIQIPLFQPKAYRRGQL